MQKLRKIGAVIASMALFLALSATAAFAQEADTPTSVKDDVIAEATPYFSVLIGVVIALFGLALLVTLARKAAGMAKGGIRRG